MMLSVAILKKRVLVDFRYRMLAFRGAGSEPPRLRLRGFTCPAIPAGVEHPSAPINFLSMTLLKDINKTKIFAYSSFCKDCCFFNMTCLGSVNQVCAEGEFSRASFQLNHQSKDNCLRMPFEFNCYKRSAYISKI